MLSPPYALAPRDLGTLHPHALQPWFAGGISGAMDTENGCQDWGQSQSQSVGHRESLRSSMGAGPTEAGSDPPKHEPATGRRGTQSPWGEQGKASVTESSEVASAKTHFDSKKRKQPEAAQRAGGRDQREPVPCSQPAFLHGLAGEAGSRPHSSG